MLKWEGQVFKLLSFASFRHSSELLGSSVTVDTEYVMLFHFLTITLYGTLGVCMSEIKRTLLCACMVCCFLPDPLLR